MGTLWGHSIQNDHDFMEGVPDISALMQYHKDNANNLSYEQAVSMFGLY